MIGTIISIQKSGCNGCKHKNTSNGMGCLGCPFSKGLSAVDDTGSPISDTTTPDMTVPPITFDQTSYDPWLGLQPPTPSPTNISAPFNTSGFTNLLSSVTTSLSRIFGPQPNLIAGTNVIYDPISGKMIPASGIGLNTSVGSFFSNPSGGISLPMILLVVGGIFLFSRK